MLMEESNNPKPPVSSTDSPLPQKKKKIVLPKKKRSFTRTLKVKKAAERDEEEDVMAETPTASSVLDRVHSQGATRHFTREELSAEVRRLNKELLSAQKQLASQQREITSLNQKNKVLLESTTKARADLREKRKAASQEQHTIKRKFNELEERAEGAESAAAEFFDAKLEKEKVSLFLFHFSPFNTITNTNIFIHSSIHR